jgi:hypothetical protein
MHYCIFTVVRGSLNSRCRQRAANQRQVGKILKSEKSCVILHTNTVAWKQHLTLGLSVKSSLYVGRVRQARSCSPKTGIAVALR